MPEPGIGKRGEAATVDADRPGPDFERQQEGGRRRRRRARALSPEDLALELEDGRRVGDVIAAFGPGVFAGSGLRLADGRLAESLVGPAGAGGLGRFGGFRLSRADAAARFALMERLRRERRLALARLGFGNTILTGPRGVTAAAPVDRRTASPV